MSTFAEVAKGLSRQAAALRAAPAVAARATAPVLQAAVREAFGHAPPLEDLAESTQAERERLGYAPNDPLVRTGFLMESWEGVAETSDAGAVAGVGSDDPLALWHEFGYFNHRTGRAVPPRPAGWEGFMAAQPRAQQIWRDTIARAIKAALGD